MLLSGFFLIWSFIPGVLIVYHLVELLRRYQRLSSALEVTVSASLTLFLWIVFTGLMAFGYIVWTLYVAPIGLVLAAVYTGFAGDALRKEKRVARARGKGFELEEQPQRYSTGPLRPPFEQRMSETPLVDTQSETQKWSPLER